MSESTSPTSAGEILVASTTRMSGEISKLRRSSKVNLAIGIGLAVAALLILFGLYNSLGLGGAEKTIRTQISEVETKISQSRDEFVACIKRGQDPNDCQRYKIAKDVYEDQKRQLASELTSGAVKAISVSELSNLIGRFTLVILVQVISFFFLRLHVSIESDVKFYVNEITNLEMRSASIALAKEEADRDAMKSVIASLTTGERNFVLKRGESAVASQNAVTLPDLHDAVGSIVAAVRPKAP